MSIRRVAVTALLVVATLALWAPSAGAASGDLDSSVGDCGVKQAPVDGYGINPLLGAPQLPVLQQRDGKVLQLAKIRNGISIARLRSGGSVDPSYGTRGVVTTIISRDAEVDGAVLAPDGKLLIATAVNFKVRLFRYTTSGALDPSFGTGGVVVIDSPSSFGLVVQSDNKPLILLDASDAFPAGGVFRLLPSGAADSSYSFVNTFNDHPEINFALGAMALQPDDRLLIAGYHLGSAFRIGRWNTDGSVDLSFFIQAPAHNNGPAGGVSTMMSLPGGKILVGGSVTKIAPNRTDLALARFLPNGTPDPTFGDAGYVNHTIGRYDAFHTMRRAGDGTIIVLSSVGLRQDVRGFSLTRFSAAGVADPTFGRSGHTTFDLASGYSPNGFGLFGTTILLVTTRRIPVQEGTYPDGFSVLVRIRTDASAAGRGLVLDGSGKLWPVGRGGSPAPCVFDGPRFTSDLARGVGTIPGQGGYVVDAFGGLHPFSLGVRPAPAAAHGGPYWPGWDIVRGVATRPNGKGGYVLDGFGGLHGFATGTNGLPARTRVSASWPGVDLARGVALLPSGTGGYVVDAHGGLHPFAVGANPMPPVAHRTFYAPGGDAARGVALLADGTGGYVVDLLGGLHAFSIGSNPIPPPPPTQPGAALGPFGARGIALVSPAAALPASTAGPASALPEPVVKWRPGS